LRSAADENRAADPVEAIPGVVLSGVAAAEEAAPAERIRRLPYRGASEAADIRLDTTFCSFTKSFDSLHAIYLTQGPAKILQPAGVRSRGATVMA
jgi:hypothetical protein